MLRRLYVDNYKCLVNFSLELGPLALLVGRNGSGKSALFEVLHGLRGLVLGDKDVATAFPPETRTRWETRDVQALELAVSGSDGEFGYKLRVEHSRRPARSKVLQETLTFDGRNLFEFNEGQVQLYKDSHEPGPQFASDWSRSSLARVPAGPSNNRLTWFKDWVRRLCVVAPNPRAMRSESKSEEEAPNEDLSNFASWYQHNAQEQPGLVSEYLSTLKSVIEGFVELAARKSGERSRTLKLRLTSRILENGATTHDYDFEELSDGQRMLLSLYALNHLGLGAKGTLCVDEPDNFVALLEIQPWLVALRERIEDSGGQALLVSHHPEVINYLAPRVGTILEREEGGPVRVRSFAADTDSGLAPSETLARGWE